MAVKGETYLVEESSYQTSTASFTLSKALLLSLSLNQKHWEPQK